MSLNNKRALTGIAFIMPWFIGFVLFYLRSFIQAVQFSFSSVELGEGTGYSLNFTGLDNLKFALLQHGNFNQELTKSVINMLIDVPLIIFFSLLMAMLLNQKFKGRTIVRAIFFLPVIMSAGAINEAIEIARQTISGGVSAVSTEMSAGSGINMAYFLDLFMQLGFPQNIIDYVTQVIARIYDVVKASGVQIIVFLASLQSVPGSLYEVSKIEGATAYETFWKITFPMVTPLILTNVVYTIVDSFISSSVVDIAYQSAFESYNYGLSSAMSLLSTVTVCVVLLIVGVILSKKTFYYN